MEKQSQTSKDIIRYLSRIEAQGIERHQIFDDFVDITEASLRMLPNHIEAARTTGQFAEDPQDVKELWDRLRSRYVKPSHSYFEEFQTAFMILLDNTSKFGYMDAIGQTYMDYANPSGWNGQYFTPYPVASMMAQITIGKIEPEINQRMTQAKDRFMQNASEIDRIVFQSKLMASYVLPDNDPDKALEFYFNEIYPMIYPYFDPIRVNDPACGSGIMFVAAAEHLPKYAVYFGLVQFYGQDIDQTCCQMARINSMLYGLNGYYIKNALALSSGELAMLPPFYADAYQQAQEAQAAGDTQLVKEIEFSLRAGRPEQLELFTMPEPTSSDNGHNNGNKPKIKRETTDQPQQIKLL